MKISSQQTNMMKLTVQQSIEEAKKDPNSDFGNQIREMIESGQLDEAAQKQGFDLSPYGRPGLKAKKRSFAEVAEELPGVGNLGKATGMLLGKKGIKESSKQAIETGNQQMTELFQRIREKEAAGEDVTRLKDAVQLVQENMRQATGTFQEFTEQMPTNKEVIADAVTLAALPLGSAAGSAMASNVAARGATGLLSRIAPLAVEGAVDVGLSTGAQKFGEGGTAGEVAASTVGGILGGAAAGPLMAGAFKLLGKGASKLKTAMSSETAQKLQPEMGLSDIVSGVAKVDDEVAQEVTKLTRKELKSGLTPDITKRVQNNPEVLEEYFEQARKRNADDTALSPTAYAGTKVDDIMKQVEQKLSEVGGEIGEGRGKIATVKVSPEDLSGVESTFDDILKKEGVLLSEGKITASSKRTPRLTNSDIKALEEMAADLKKLKSDPTTQRIVDTMNKFKNVVNFKKSAGEVSNAIDPIARRIGAELKKLRDTVGGGGLKGTTEEFSELMGVMEEYNKLTSKGRNSEFLIKRLYSDRDRLGKEVVEQIKEITGEDIMDHAMYSKLATEILGNSGQKSLLQQSITNAGVEAADIINMAPGKFGAILDMVTGIGKKAREEFYLQRGTTSEIVDAEDLAELIMETSRKKSFKKGAVPETANLDNPMAKKVIGTLESGDLSLNKAGEVVEAGVDDLATQAKKYKTADEFVKAQFDNENYINVFHGANDYGAYNNAVYRQFGFDDLLADPQLREANTGGNRLGLSTSKSYETAKDFAFQTDGTGVVKYTIKNDDKVYKLKGKTLDDLTEAETRELSKKYNAIYDFDNVGGENEIRLLNYDSVVDSSRQQTKTGVEDIPSKLQSQLTDIWNKANKTKPNLPTGKSQLDNLATQAKKFDNVDEFVKAQGKPLYHHSVNDIARFKNTKNGTWFTDNQYGYQRRPNAKFNNESYVDITKLNLISKKDFNKIPKKVGKYDEVWGELKKRGYDGLTETVEGDKQYLIFDSSQIKTKSQLTDIWNKANR